MQVAITIKDIARLANVSITTVSKVINNKDDSISEQTKNKILQIIKETNYQPNAIARSLVTKKTKTIGLIIPDITNPFFPEIARGAEDCANIYGYNIFLCNTDDNAEKENNYIAVLREKCVDGIIFTSSSIPKYEHIIDLIDSGIPVVMIDRSIEPKLKNVYGVFLDNYKGGYLATKYLIELGHRNIACITGPLYTKSAIERLNGYKKALSDFNIEINNSMIIEGDFKINSGMVAAEKIIENKDVTGIFACNDLMAYGVYKTLKKKGYRIPDDISIVGFDDIQLSQILEPQLTTIKQPSYDMGLTATRVLIKLIEGEKVRKKVVKFEPSLIERKSVREYHNNI